MIKLSTLVLNLYISSVQFGMRASQLFNNCQYFFYFFYSNSSDQVDVIYLDIKQAFDSIPHNKLLDKLYSYDIQGKLWKWFKSYLTGRSQHVRINKSLSTPLLVLSGVLLGSILGLLLFIIYVINLPACLNISIHSYYSLMIQKSIILLLILRTCCSPECSRFSHVMK